MHTKRTGQYVERRALDRHHPGNRVLDTAKVQRATPQDKHITNTTWLQFNVISRPPSCWDESEKEWRDSPMVTYIERDPSRRTRFRALAGSLRGVHSAQDPARWRTKALKIGRLTLYASQRLVAGCCAADYRSGPRRPGVHPPVKTTGHHTTGAVVWQNRKSDRP